jgi:hypothetical protein
MPCSESAKAKTSADRALTEPTNFRVARCPSVRVWLVARHDIKPARHEATTPAKEVIAENRT